MRVPWPIEGSDEFAAWYHDLTDAEVESVNLCVSKLEDQGPSLGRPDADTLKGSRIPNLKELRVQHQGRPYRILYAFDPRRVGYLILGGDKTGDRRWYKMSIPVAERIYAKHLKELEE